VIHQATETTHTHTSKLSFVWRNN